MTNTILVDGKNYLNLLPLTYTRPASKIRCGILQIDEKWHILLGRPTTFKSAAYLNDVWPASVANDNILINSAVLPTHDLALRINQMDIGDQLDDNGMWVASRLDKEQTIGFFASLANYEKSTDKRGIQNWIHYPEDILNYNAREIHNDLQLISNGRASENLDSSNFVRGDQLFVEEGARVYNTTINTESGPVYIGKDAVILEGSHIIGPVAIGEKSILKMGSKIYGATSTGPYCKLGGEVKNSVLFAHSNKSHDGYLGDSIIGSWCNFGAGSSTSNMKNTYGKVSLFNCAERQLRMTDRQFLGVVFGDHSKCAINTSFSTGTVVGVFANIFDYNPKQFVPSFSWGKDGHYLLDKALTVAGRAMARKGMELTAEDIQILTHLHHGQ